MIYVFICLALVFLFVIVIDKTVAYLSMSFLMLPSCLGMLPPSVVICNGSSVYNYICLVNMEFYTTFTFHFCFTRPLWQP